MKRFLHPQSLMTLLLAALGVFLALYLCDVYETEEKRLRKEAGYLFGSAMKDIERALLTELIDFKIDSVHKDHSAHGAPDSLVAIVNIDIESDEVVQNDTMTNRKVHVIKKTHHRFATDKKLLMFDFDMQEDFTTTNFHADSTFQNKFINKIINQFDENLNNANLKIGYTFAMKDSMALDDPIAWLQKRNNADTILKAGLRLGDNKAIILRNTMPQFILVTILYLGLITAFIYLLRSLSKERKLLELKNDFIQNMTHELKTPISTMKVAFEAAQTYRSSQPDRREEYLAIAEDQTNRLSDLVQRVLSIFQIDQEQPKPSLEETNIDHVIFNVVEALGVKAEAKKIELDYHQQPLAPIICDPQWLQMILHNIIDNAIKYNHRTHDGRVDIHTTAQDNSVQIRVQDNGPGISAEHLPYIFEKFFRAPEGNVHNTKGHGLGLYFSRKLAHILGGELTYQSLTDGSVFTITIPKHG